MSPEYLKVKAGGLSPFELAKPDPFDETRCTNRASLPDSKAGAAPWLALPVSMPIDSIIVTESRNFLQEQISFAMQALQLSLQ